MSQKPSNLAYLLAFTSSCLMIASLFPTNAEARQNRTANTADTADTMDPNEYPDFQPEGEVQTPPPPQRLQPAPVAMQPAGILQNDLARFKSLLSQGKGLIGQGRFEESLPILSQAISLNNRSLEVWFFKGLALAETGKTKEAVSHYVWSLKLATLAGMDSAELRINLGNSLLKMGYFKEALFDYQRAVEIEPKNPIAYLFLANAFLSAGKYQEALEQLRKSDALGCHRPESAYLRSLALLGLGESEDARKELLPLLSESAKVQAPLVSRLAQSLSRSISPSTLRPDLHP